MVVLVVSVCVFVQCIPLFLLSPILFSIIWGEVALDFHVISSVSDTGTGVKVDCDIEGKYRSLNYNQISSSVRVLILMMLIR